MPQISVIAPVYNVEKYLHACLDSILAQTFTDFELILIDDGSPDSSGKICDEYAEKDNRIRVFHQENQGQAAARNFGVSQAKAEWIHFVDSDDLIHPQMLEILYRSVQSTKVKISMCSAYEGGAVPQDFFSPCQAMFQYDESKEKVLDYFYENVKYMYWVIWGKLIKKDLVEQYPFFRGRVYEDNAVVFKWLVNSEMIAWTDLQLYFYRTNPTGTTKRGFTVKQADFLFALEEQVKFYKANGYSKLLNKIAHRYLTEYSVIYNKIIYELNDKKFAKKIRKHAIWLWVKNFRVFANCKSELLFSLETLFPELHSIVICFLKFLKRA